MRTTLIEDAFTGFVVPEKLDLIVEIEEWLTEQACTKHFVLIDTLITQHQNVDPVTLAERLEVIYKTYLRQLCSDIGIHVDDTMLSLRQLFLIAQLIKDMDAVPGIHDTLDDFGSHADWLQELMELQHPMLDVEWFAPSILALDWVVLDQVIDTLKEQVEDDEHFEALADWIRARFFKSVFLEDTTVMESLDEYSAFTDLTPETIPEEWDQLPDYRLAKEFVARMVCTTRPTEEFIKLAESYWESHRPEESNLAFLQECQIWISKVEETEREDI